MKNVFYISIGSNIKKEKNIKKCARFLKKEFKKISFSRVFETKPVGFQNQENFLNAVARAETKKSIFRVKKGLAQIEKKLKRKRTKIKSGPRTIDLDIIIWNKKTVDKNAAASYNLPGLREVLVFGEADKKIEKKLAKLQKMPKATRIFL